MIPIASPVRDILYPRKLLHYQKDISKLHISRTKLVIVAGKVETNPRFRMVNFTLLINVSRNVLHIMKKVAFVVQ